MFSTITMRAAGVALVLSAAPEGMPRVLHWGQDLGEINDDQAQAVQLAARWPRVNNAPDASPHYGIIPEARYGWTGRPGLIGSRIDGSAWSPSWELTMIVADGAETSGNIHLDAGCVEFHLTAKEGLAMVLAVEMLPTGLARARATLTNTDAAEFRIEELTLAFPVPSHVRKLMDFAGRWVVERVAQTAEFGVGNHRRENRHGRSGHDSATILSAANQFDYEHDEIWATHVAWSGNHIHQAERDFIGGQLIGGGELLLPSEGRLEEGESYASPWVYFNYARGLDGQAARFHDHVRRMSVQPKTDRPVTLNVWEAVYFDHDAERLIDLAERAANLGVERYVLDDGWFGGRRNDHAGLGDWVVSPDMWPDGLHPLVDKVKALGMQFGLWFEPEMVNMDSDVARAHPEWVMQVENRLPTESRHQQVLNLGIPEAFEHVYSQMSAIFEEYAIDYVKWDHNRDLTDAGTAPVGNAGTAEQTRAYYRLLDQLRERFPHIEFEACASGGGRIDLEVMERSERVWVSDNSDPQDRQRMLWWTGQLLPLERMGSHVASGRSHVTGRWHDLEFRAATAVFGHFGIEWDLAQATDQELAQLSRWIEWYKEHRTTLHTGKLHRVAMPDDGVYFKGIVTDEEAIFSFAMLEGATCVSVGQLRFPGLDREAKYRIDAVAPEGMPLEMQVPWLLSEEPLTMTGAALAGIGLQAPIIRPNQATIIVLTRV